LGQATIEILEDIVIVHVEQPLLHLVKFVYPGYMHNLTFDGFFNDGAILCPTIECLDEVNEFILSLILEEEVSYLVQTPLANLINKKMLKLSGLQMNF